MQPLTRIFQIRENWNSQRHHLRHFCFFKILNNPISLFASIPSATPIRSWLSISKPSFHLFHSFPFQINHSAHFPMSRRALDSRQSIDSCTLKLHGWRPFQLHSAPKTLDSDVAHSSAPPTNSKPYYSSSGLHTKRPCLSDRTTSFNVDAIDMSRLSLMDDDKPSIAAGCYTRRSFRLIARKRRRRGSRSVSGRSSDRSGTRRCCSVGASAAHGTCSDFPVAVGTDSSGELFVNGDANWSSDVSEAKNSRRERGEEKDHLGGGFSSNGGFDAQGNESGYGSEPGYRGDGEFGYGDEIDEEDEDARLLLWGEQLEDSRMEIVGENTFTDQKSHHRCRRKKHECRMVDALR